MTDSNNHVQPLSPQADAGLETFFEAARTTAPVMGDDLMNRIVADAAALRAQTPKAEPMKMRSGWFASIGGWPSFAALSTAMIAGLWIGYSPPTGLETLTAGFFDSEDATVEIFNVMPSYDDLFAVEG